MSTINKQRFAVSFVFTIFLSVGFVVSHTLAGIHGSADQASVIAKTVKPVEVNAVVSKSKLIAMFAPQVKK